MRQWPTAAFLLGVLALGACDDGDADGAPDAARDGAPTEAGPPGDMQPDTRPADARPVDAAPDAAVDAGAPDARGDAASDAAPDGMTPDRGPLDAAPVDALPIDALPLDARADGRADAGPPWIGEGTCDPAAVVTLDAIDRQTGTTDGRGADGEPSCSDGAGASEQVFTWVAPEDGLACVSLAEAAFDTVLYVREADCGAAEAEVACNDDAEDLGLGVQSAVTVDVRAGVRYFAFVDGYAGGDVPQSGDFALQIGRGPCRDGGRLRCADAADCPADRICDGGGCVECAVDGDCPDGFRCAEQACEPGAMMGVGACAPGRQVIIDGFDVYRGDNRQAPVDDLGSCNAGTIGPEVAHVFTPTVDGPVCARTIGSDPGLDTVVYVRRTCAEPGSELVCHDDVADGVIVSAADFDAVAGEPVVVFVDTYTLDDSGTYILGLLPGPCADAPVCGDDMPCPAGFECRINGCLPL